MLEDAFTLPDTVFRFASPSQILYGRGAATRFAEHFSQLLGEQAKGPVLVVTDEILISVGITGPVVEALAGMELDVEIFARQPEEPTAAAVNALGNHTACVDPVGIVAIGGGATMDSAKSARVLHQFGGRIEEYEGIGTVPAPATIPLAAIATTSGTGSETGYAALFTHEETSTKRFVGSPHMVPDLAVVDPDLTASVPPATTAHTGIDALAQAIGPFLSPLRHPITDVLAREAVRLLGGNLLAAYRDGTDMTARSAMAYGSLMMGLAMNNAECIGEHFFAEIVGPRYSIPHGVSVGMFLPYILQFNRNVSAARLAALAALFVEDPAEDDQTAIDQFVGFTNSLLGELDLPTLRDIGVRSRHLDELTDHIYGHIGIELDLNPRPMNREDCARILAAAYDEIPALEMAV
ncbi:MAG: iron-containing alcohol dehydrogenase [bacterium]|nr:iron-containing alcohol dehydrogenase [bacterium]MDE0287334.1 iron-containing alcohol dehydrogenase [bacterium]MDE0439153.1 iron-containing alcohol dehydrogenase [bacterium]